MNNDAKILGCELSSLQNESDVEQKLIVPMLLEPIPLGLGFSVSDFRTKADIRRLKIGKGNEEKMYMPDYIIILAGLPMVVIEAKHPDEGLDSAMREGRLYASELNALFPSGLNPCRFVVGCNGKEIRLVKSDSRQVVIDLKFADLHSASPNYAKFVEKIGKPAIVSEVKKIRQGLHSTSRAYRPLHMLGGKAIRTQELPSNSFGEVISVEFRSHFNPESDEDRAKIAKYAYVESEARSRHTSPIQEVIRAAIPPSSFKTTHLEDRKNPDKFLSKLQEAKDLKHEVILLVGSVGSGKTLFVDYLREVALPQEIRERTIWVRLDLNNAPMSREKLYDWVMEGAINSLRNSFKDIDFDDYETVLKLYSVEYNRFKKTFGPILGEESSDFKSRLADMIADAVKDKKVTTNAMIRYLSAEKGRTMIIVLDNCDKRNRDDQLLMFEVAQWLRSEFHCIVVLPLRDITFDLHQKEPPLDTAIKDLTFRIDPPPLMKVLYRRVKLALDEMDSGNQSGSYELANGMKVAVPKDDKAYYLFCILKSLFSDRFVRTVIEGLASRDIRRGIEVFLEVCRSGHIAEEEFVRIRKNEGNYTLPKHVSLWVLLRGRYRFYSDATSYVRSLFYSDPVDGLKDPFVRVDILNWLRAFRKEVGPSGIRGFHKISRLISDLVAFGHSDDRVKAEVANLVKVKCILCESELEDVDDIDQLVSIAPSGVVHLDLLNEISYLSACSEDTWFEEQERADRIAKRITSESHRSAMTAIENSRDLLEYLSGYRKRFFISNPVEFLSKASPLPDWIQFSSEAVDAAGRKLGIVPVSEIESEFPSGMVCSGRVVSVQQYGVFVELDSDSSVSGFAHVSAFKSDDLASLKKGDRLSFKVQGLSQKHQRLTLELPEFKS
jgi:cold shock CspA family protein